MRALYLAAGVAQVVSGFLSLILSNDLFGGYGGDVGLIPISAGLVHLLNWKYGPVTRGFRYCALLAGIPASVLGVWQGLQQARWEEAVIVLLCPLATLLSFSVWPQLGGRVRQELAQ